jgi:hypothetical protein
LPELPLERLARPDPVHAGQAVQEKERGTP